ncbi:MAG: MltA domain-containing protein [Saprospiraceae bacterium]
MSSMSCINNDAEIGAFSIIKTPTKTIENSHENKKFNKIFTPSNIDTTMSISMYSETLPYLEYHKRMIQRQRRGKKFFNIDGLTFNKDDLEFTTAQLGNWGSSAFVPLSAYFDTYQIKGKSGKGDVLFTGYYSPVLRVSSIQNSEYRYPIYAKPKEMIEFPSRADIYRGALEGQAEILAYARNLLEIHQMQLQGSGYVVYENGKKYLFSYGGSNRHPRRSIQKYFVEKHGGGRKGASIPYIKKYIQLNPETAESILSHDSSFVFFEKNKSGSKVKGSGNVPLTPFLSIATDKRYIPTGACLIGYKPLPGKSYPVRYEPTLLLAQDVGGAIKGTGHIDLYCGVGEQGRKATGFRDNGFLWLLLARKERNAEYIPH